MNVSILGSGTGSNAEAILKYAQAGKLGKAHIVGILSDKPDARILRLGERFGVPACHLDPGGYRTRLSDEAEQAYVQQLCRWETDLVVLAGFMRVIKKPLLKAFAGRIINLHPSLLPKYPGLESVRRAVEAGEQETGCTVHWVNETVDGGDIIRQSVVPIAPGVGYEQVMERVHAAEHALLPAVIRELSMERE